MTANTTYYAQWNCNADGYAEPACITRGTYLPTNSGALNCRVNDIAACVCIGKAQRWSMCDA